MVKHSLFGLTFSEENDYRKFCIREDAKLAKFGLLLVAIAWLVFIFNDYQIFGLSSTLLVFAAARIVLAAATALVAINITRINTYQGYDRAIFVWVLILVVAMLATNATRPQNFITHSVIAAAAITLIGLYIPTKFLNQAVLASVCAVGEIMTVTYSLQWASGLFTIIFSLAVVLIVTVACSYRLQSYRRRNYKNLIDLSKMKNKMEEHSKDLEKIVEEKTAQLKHSERLSTIGMTAGMIGHDIRNPLQAIVSDIYLLKTDLASTPKSEVKEDIIESIDSIEENVAYINKIIADLQDYARPLNPNCISVNLQGLVTNTVQTITIPKNVTSLVDIDATLQMEIDTEFFRRILSNLVLNAIQAMPNGGNLTVSAYEKDGNVLINVEDTGTGIPEEIKPKLFTPMVTTKSKGQGLGLAVVKRLVEALNGTIRFESQKGKGTKFVIEMPSKQSVTCRLNAFSARDPALIDF